MKISKLIYTRLESIFKHLKKDIHGWLISYNDIIVNIMKCLEGETEEDLLLPEGLKVVGIYHSEDKNIDGNYKIKIVGSPDSKMKCFENSKLVQEKDLMIQEKNILDNENFIRLKFDYEFLIEKNENFEQKFDKLISQIKKNSFKLKNEKNNFEILLKIEENEENDWKISSGIKKSIFFDIISFETSDEHSLVRGLLKQINFLKTHKEFHTSTIHHFYHYLPEDYPNIFTLYYPFEDSNFMYEEINSKKLSNF